MSTELDKARAMHARVEAIRAYAGTEVHGHVLALLAHLKDGYMQELIEISPQDLQLKQGALRQVIALQLAITEPDASPRI